MDPEVPQALRLQAILIGGIVIVHAKQQAGLGAGPWAGRAQLLVAKGAFRNQKPFATKSAL